MYHTVTSGGLQYLDMGNVQRLILIRDHGTAAAVADWLNGSHNRCRLQVGSSRPYSYEGAYGTLVTVKGDGSPRTPRERWSTLFDELREFMKTLVPAQEWKIA